MVSFPHSIKLVQRVILDIEVSTHVALNRTVGLTVNISEG